MLSRAKTKLLKSNNQQWSHPAPTMKIDHYRSYAGFMTICGNGPLGLGFSSCQSKWAGPAPTNQRQVT